MNNNAVLNQDFFHLFDISPVFSVNLEMIGEKYHQLIKAAHPDNFVSSPQMQVQSLALASKINEAYRVLSHPVRRAVYLLKIHGVDLEAKGAVLSQSLIARQFSFSEELEDAENNIEKLNILYTSVQNQMLAIQNFLEQVDFSVKPDQNVVEKIAELKFLAKVKLSLSEKLCP